MTYIETLRAAHAALSELYATVKGECPSLLNEDSGGNARLDIEVSEAITALTAALAATAQSTPELEAPAQSNVDAQSEPVKQHEFHNCVFAGPPPEGFDTWPHWTDGPRLEHVRITSLAAIAATQGEQEK